MKISLFLAVLFVGVGSHAKLSPFVDSIKDPLVGSVKDPKPKSEYLVVTSTDGIPVYSSLDTEEHDICSWLPYGAYVEASKTEVEGLLELHISTPSANCPLRSKVYIQDGFLERALYAGPATRGSSQRWKSEIPSLSTRCVPQRSGQKILVSFVGDLLLHGPIQRQAHSSSHGFRVLWSQLERIFKASDISYANLEGPVAEGLTCRGKIGNSNNIGGDCRKDGSAVYSSYPTFNYHPRLITDLKQSGFGVVSTSNNHSLDRRSLGADMTVDALVKARMPYTGTRKAGTSDPYYTITQVRGFNIAWLGCTFSTNGIPDSKNQVLWCFSKNGAPNPELLGLVKALKASKSVSGVIVTPHWGPVEYVHSVHPTQLRLGKELIEAGASAVVGAHPHVLQPWEIYKSSDGREGLIHYSLGNFVSSQTQAARRASIVLLVGFQKDREGKMLVDGVRFVPMFFDNWNSAPRQLVPLNEGQRHSAHGQESLSNILSIYPSELRLNSSDRATSCLR